MNTTTNQDKLIYLSFLILICFSIFLIINFLIATDIFADPKPGDPSMEQIVQSNKDLAIAHMISVLILKITAFILGFLIVRLGHDTFIKGITGEIDFGFSGGGFSTKLKAGSPGAFFILAGAAIIIWGLAVQKPFKFSISPRVTQQAESSRLPATGQESGKQMTVPKDSTKTRPFPDLY